MKGRFLKISSLIQLFGRIILAILAVQGSFWALPEIPSAEPLKSPLINLLGEYDQFASTGDIRRFDGETLKWEIDFLFFEKAATAEVKFLKKKGHYESTLVAETKGVVGFFTSYRKHYYHSVFEITEDGKRVRTSRFERQVIIGDDVERTTHILDYGARAHFWFRYENDKLVEQDREDIPEGVYMDDVLAAFYNFRNGVYGDVGKGKKYRIDTIPDKSMKDIKVYVHTDQEKKNHSDNGEDQSEYLITITIPKDVFKTKTGQLVFSTSRHLVPLETTVKDYVLLGDLHGVFSGGVHKGTNEVAKALPKQ